jgi:hypothetical protein
MTSERMIHLHPCSSAPPSCMREEWNKRASPCRGVYDWITAAGSGGWYACCASEKKLVAPPPKPSLRYSMKVRIDLDAGLGKV